MLGEPQREYKELKFLGRLHPRLCKRNLRSEFSMTKRPAPLKDIDPEQWAEWDNMVRDKFFWNDPTYSSVEASEMRMDEVRPWPEMDDFKRLALSYVDRILEAPLSADMMTHEEVMAHMDLKKTPSVPWRYMGYKTRKDFFDSLDWHSMKDSVAAHELIGHLYRVVPKDAWSDIADWDADKTRTFLVPGAHVLYWQLRLFGPGTEAIKNFSWSKYGFNPFSGNVHRMACQLLLSDENGAVYPIKLYWDIAGYDRFIFLHHVADRRLRAFNSNIRNITHRDFAKWVTDGLKRNIIIMSNGDICIRRRGNNSGSGMTTANNIEAGFEVVCDLLIVAYHARNNRLPTYEEVFDQLVALYGDDNMSALMETFEWMLNQDLISNRLMQKHGLKLKVIGGGRETPLNELSFLGFTFYDDCGVYVPRWNIERLLVPLVYVSGSTKLSTYMQRFYSILILSYAHPQQWEIIRSAYLRLLTYASYSGSPEIKAIVRLGAPTRETLRFFYTGLETGGGWPNLNMSTTYLHDMDLDDYVPGRNYKGDFLDWCATHKHQPPEFTTEPTGPQHAPTFFGTLIFQGKPFTATGGSKRDTEQRISAKIMRYLRNSDITRRTVAEAQFVATKNAVSAGNNANVEVRLGGLTISNRTPDVPDSDKTVVWFMQFMDSFSLYAELTESEKPYHPLHAMLNRSGGENKRRMAQWLADSVKQGSFNPYGNGQTAQYTIVKPTVVNLQTQYICSSTCLIPNGVNIVGYGETPEDAFNSWKDQVCDAVDAWAPPPADTPLRSVFRMMRQMPRSANTPITYLWDLPEEEAWNKFWDQFKEGSYNPYGNGNGVVPTAPPEDDHATYPPADNPPTPSRHCMGYMPGLSGTWANNDYDTVVRGPTNDFHKLRLRSPPIQPMPLREPVYALQNLLGFPEICLDSPDSVASAAVTNSTILAAHIAGGGIFPPTTGKLIVYPDGRAYTWIEYEVRNPRKINGGKWIPLVFEGSFNPYGNGQPGSGKAAKMSYVDWAKMNGRMIAPMTLPDRKAAYNRYLNKKRTARGPKKGPQKPPPSKLKVNYPNGRGRVPIDATVQMKLSGCAAAYALALNNPWAWVDRSNSSKERGLKVNFDENPCIPMFPAIKTRKFWCRAQGVFGIQNANDVGYIMACPFRMANDNLLNNNSGPPLLFSVNTQAYATSNFPIVDTGAAWASGAANVNSDYTSASLLNNLGVGIQYRVVGASLRIQYQGNPINVAGTYHRVVDPDHATLSGQLLTDFSQYESYSSVLVSESMFKTNKWLQVNYTPVNQDDFQFHPDSMPNALVNVALTRNHFMGVLIVGAPVGNNFKYDFVVHWEAIGRIVRGKTETPCDPTGTAVAVSTLKSETQRKLDTGTPIVDALRDGANQVTATGLTDTMAKMATEIVPTMAKLIA